MPDSRAAELAGLPLKERIRYAVKNTGRGTQEDFARRLGTKRETVNGWVKGRHTPGEFYALKIALEAGLPRELFLYDDVDPAERLLERLDALLPLVEKLVDEPARATPRRRSGEPGAGEVMEELREHRALLEDALAQLARAVALLEQRQARPGAASA